ncbi:efflux RND transporter periplasmic adaptor subunit [Desulfospira joergensenii]|uniref:efflux RND transporter periplasmic adaptor subunit n=1 Tax=Desulfospira joergensenii TaxID=53329 RepID=UPI0003B56258|nr:efflux RND transporter periplasmic adaptor subunit [Desulfospira joergensenii]
MESKTGKSSSFFKSLLPLIWRAIPFAAVLVVIVLVILPLNKKIAAKKADLQALRLKQTGDHRALTNVTTLELVPQMLTEKISLPGVAKPWISLEVVSEVKGKVIRKIDQGRQVKKGDILAVIDQRDYQNSYDSALASYETALINKKRFAALSGKQFVTQSQLDDAAARVKTTRAAMENAKLNLERCTIRASMNGVVDRTYIEPGSFLAVGDPVVKLLKMDKLKIEVGIPESDVDAVRKLTAFDMTIDALGNKPYQGEFHYLYKSTDSMARLYTLEIQVDNEDLQILPDMFVRVSVVKNTDPQGLAVPMYSLVSLKNQTGVFVEKQGMVHFRPVRTGFQDGWKTQIVQGLEPQEHVVVMGHRIIEDGEKVNVTATAKTMEGLNP